MKKLLVLLLISSFAFQAPVSSAQAGDGVVGAIIGAVAGGLIGSKAGRGGAAIGIIAGAVIGHEIDQALDNDDRRYYGNSQREALSGEVGRTYRWNGSPRTGNRGEIIILREGYHSSYDTVCREYRSTIYLGRGRTETTTGVACQSTAGSWYECDTMYVKYGPRPMRPGPGRPGPGRPGRPGYLDTYRCETTSNRKWFREYIRAYSRGDALDQITRLCDRAFGTDYRECSRNARCN